MSFGGKARAILLTIVTFGPFLIVSAGSGVALRADNRKIFRTAKALIGVLVYAGGRQV
jgi:hypothetical protein